MPFAPAHLTTPANWAHVGAEARTSMIIVTMPSCGFGKQGEAAAGKKAGGVRPISGISYSSRTAILHGRGVKKW